MGFDSLYTGISGLNAYQSWIDMISNNIANVDTTGFKGQSMTFADLFYQSQSFATAPTTTNGGIDGQQIGLGVKVGSVDTEFAQGGLQTTGVATNLAINGNGFFILNNLNGQGTPTYTRDGNFTLNQDGTLIDPASGLAVQGYSANSNGVVTPGGATGNITIPVGLQEQATATGTGVKVGPNSGDDVFDVALGGNLDQTQWQQSFLNTINASTTTAQPYTVSATVYDSLGNAHLAEITYIPDSTGAAGAQATATNNGTLASVPTVLPATNQNDTITITSTATGYTIKDTLTGTTQTVLPGSTAVVDGTTITTKQPLPAVVGTTDTIKVQAAQSGLPSVVQNASSTNVTPATRWKVEVTFTDGTTFNAINQPGKSVNGVVSAANAPTYTTTSSGVIGYAYFDQNGQFINTSSIETATGAQGLSGGSLSAYFHSSGGQPSVADGNQLNVTLWGQSAGNAATAPTAGGVSAGSVATPGPIGLDFAGNSQEGGVGSLAGSYTATVLSQNGYAAGTLQNLTVGTDGIVTGDFSNGQQKTLAQVAMATFANEDGLTREGGNQFAASATSGLAQIGTANTGNFGSIQSGALEQSNVSLSTEFTNLIIAQRAFEANTRGITTADQNLQTIINLRGSEN